MPIPTECLPNPCRLGGPQLFTPGKETRSAHLWAEWLQNPCLLGGPQCSAQGLNLKWHTCGHTGYLTPAVSGAPSAQHGDKIRIGPHVGIVAP